MPGHPSRNRVDGKFNFNAFFFEKFSQVIANMLGLGDGKSITRNDNDFLGVTQKDTGIAGSNFFYYTTIVFYSCSPAPEGTNDYIEQ